MLTTVDLVTALINSEHGWAVAGQFEDTFNGERFDNQNYNALVYIRDTINELLRSNLLHEDAQDELQTYRDELEDYIMGGGEDDDNTQDDDEDYLSSMMFGVDNKQ